MLYGGEPWYDGEDMLQASEFWEIRIKCFQSDGVTVIERPLLDKIYTEG